MVNSLTSCFSNDCLKKLVEMGADISHMETLPGVANLLVKVDFDEAIAPKLWLLSDFGFDLSQVARVMTVVPKAIIKVSYPHFPLVTLLASC